MADEMLTEGELYGLLFNLGAYELHTTKEETDTKAVSHHIAAQSARIAELEQDSKRLEWFMEWGGCYWTSREQIDAAMHPEEPHA